MVCAIKNFRNTSYGSSLKNITPQDYYLDHQAECDFPKLDSFPLDPVDYWRTGFIWRQYFFFFVAYMFGLRHAGWAGQAITSAVTWAHKRSGLEYDGELFNALNCSDDLAGCEEGDRTMVSFLKISSLLQELGLQEATDKASPPSTQMEYLGVCFDSVSLQKYISPSKIAELKDLLFTWLRKKTCTKRCLQSLDRKASLGSLLFQAL